jgi:hypothetical protein
MRKVFLLGMSMLVLLVLTGCTAGPNEMENSSPEEGEVAGFWQGLWHGVVAPITLVVSLFQDNVGMYEVYNNGAWYNFGFLLGLVIVWGGGGGGAARASCPKDRKREEN